VLGAMMMTTLALSRLEFGKREVVLVLQAVWEA
jgi:hypothetical protein